MMLVMDRSFLLIGSLFGLTGVMLGAFATHALRDRLSIEMLIAFEAGARYQMYHALALLIVAVTIGNMGAARLLVAAGWLFCAGVVLFSGSLYALALTGTTALGAITPIGGVLLIAGWACLAVFALLR